MKYGLKIALLLLFAAPLVGCGQKSSPQEGQHIESPKGNSIYHWKGTFDLDSTEVALIERHDIKRIYLRMFDVVVEQNLLDGALEVVPIATTRFLSKPPQGVEILPVTYIVLDALRAMAGREEEFATLIVDRLLAMASYNGCGEVKEIQLDCDWTASTKQSYNRLCQLVRQRAWAKNIRVSATIRLHQLREAAPPVDKGVLMLYNTGALKSPETKNSILDIDDAKPYIRATRYPIPLDYAYPLFGWGVQFENDRFVSIVAEDAVAITPQSHIRYERPTVSEIMAVKRLVEQQLGKPASGNILYHLDNEQLKNYTDDEIAQIYND